MYSAVLFLSALIACSPLFFLPVTQDYYDTNKWLLLLTVALALPIAWLISRLVDRRPHAIRISRISLGLLGIGIAGLLTVILTATNRVEALLSPLGPVTFLALAVFAGFLPTLLGDRGKAVLRSMLYTGVSITALIAVYQFFGIGKFMLPGIPYLADPLWTPTGSTPATLSLFLIFLPPVVSDALRSIREKRELSGAVFAIMAIAITAGTVLTAVNYVPKIPASVLPFSASWTIALEGMKNPLRALFGVGPESYLNAFSIGRPLWYNTTPLWATRFVHASNIPLHFATVYGIVGLISYILFLRAFLPRKPITPDGIGLAIAALLTLAFPPNLTMFIVLALYCIVSDHHKAHELSVKPPESPAITLGLLACAGILSTGILFFAGRAYAAELAFYRSLMTAKSNNGTKTYNEQVRAIKLNPYIGRYHIIYSQTNLALASTLASGLANPETTATSEQKNRDRNLIAQLTQQAIREAKIATTLNKTSVLPWENLARIYEQLIDIATDADKWSDAAFKQAIIYDPVNPVLYLEVGSVAMKRKQYQDAVAYFQKAAAVKENYANAYYNLAYAYRAQGDMANTKKILVRTLDFVTKGSEDYNRVLQELQNLDRQTATPSALPAPAATPSPTVTPQITLPVDAQLDLRP